MQRSPIAHSSPACLLGYVVRGDSEMERERDESMLEEYRFNKI